MTSIVERLATLLPECTRSESDGFPVPDDTTVYRDLPYTSGADLYQCLDLYIPASSSGDPLPIIVYMHHGCFYCGDKSESTVILRHLTVGYAVALANYRLVPEVMYPAPIVDYKSAIRFLRANASKYNLNPKCVIATGFSTGGYLAAMVGATQNVPELDIGDNLDYPSSVQAVIVMAGPMDFMVTHQYRKEMGTVGDEHDVSEALFIGGFVEDNQVAAKQASPLTHLSADAPPFLVFHGDADTSVPLVHSQLLVAKLVEVHVPVLHKVLKDVAHIACAGSDDVFYLTQSFLNSPLVMDAS